MKSPLSDSLRSLAKPVPRAAFREQVRGEFLTDADTTVSKGSSKTRWVGVAMAASLLIAFGFWSLNSKTPQWQILSQDGGYVSGTIHNSGSSPMHIELGDAVQWRLLPGTTIRLSPPESGEPLQVFVEEGTALGTTGPKFPKTGLQINAEYLNVMVTGTTFGVLAGPDSTCICVLEGVIQIEDQGGETIPAGSILTRYATRSNTGVLGEPQRRMLEAVRDLY